MLQTSPSPVTVKALLGSEPLASRRGRHVRAQPLHQRPARDGTADLLAHVLAERAEALPALPADHDPPQPPQLLLVQQDRHV
jgi:hypothetical protein